MEDEKRTITTGPVPDRQEGREHGPVIGLLLEQGLLNPQQVRRARRIQEKLPHKFWLYVFTNVLVFAVGYCLSFCEARA